MKHTKILMAIVMLGALALFLLAGKAFAGEATVSWTPPTTKVDGSPLDNLAGFRIYYGTSASAMTQVVQVPGATVTSRKITGIADGTWYFSVRAYNTDGVESGPSNVPTKAIVTPPSPPTNVTISSIGLRLKSFDNGFLHLAMDGSVERGIPCTLVPGDFTWLGLADGKLAVCGPS